MDALRKEETNTMHQRLLNYIRTGINLYIRQKGGECEVFPAPFAVFLSKDNKDYVEPDISINGTVFFWGRDSSWNI